MRLFSLIFLLTFAFTNNAFAEIELVNTGKVCVFMLEAKDRQGGTADFQSFPNIEIEFTSAMPDLERLSKPLNVNNLAPGTGPQNQWEEFLRIGRTKNPVLLRSAKGKELLDVVSQVDEKAAARQDAAIRRIFRGGYQANDKGTFTCQGNARGKNFCGTKQNRPCFGDNVLNNADIPNFNFCSFQGILAGHSFTLGTDISFQGKPQEGKCLDAEEKMWVNWQGDGLNGRDYPDVLMHPLRTFNSFGETRNHYPILTTLRFGSFIDENGDEKYRFLPRVPRKAGKLGLTGFTPPPPFTGPPSTDGTRRAIGNEVSTAHLPLSTANQGRIVEFWLIAQPDKRTAKDLAGNLAPLLTNRNYVELTKTVHPRPLDEGHEFLLPDKWKFLLYRSPILIGIVTIKLLPDPVR